MYPSNLSPASFSYWMVVLKAYARGRWNILLETALPISPQKISEMQTSDHGLIGHEQHKQHEKVNETCLFLSP